MFFRASVLASPLLLSGLARALPRPLPRQTNDTAPFDWLSVEPAADLTTLVPCFDSFVCGRLSVPLDYSCADSEAKAVIPVIVLPAQDQANRKGSVLFNPGGPGNSGVNALIGFAKSLAQLVGPFYDVVGFDQRGTGASIPSGHCFEADEWKALTEHDILAIDTDDELKVVLDTAQAVGDACAAKLGEAARFLDTGSTANDLLSIVRALGQDKLNYIGISYGTAIGQYFAAMHPDNVGLMLLDGVVDAERWRKAEIVHMLQDADQVAATFVSLCTQAPRICNIAGADEAETGSRINKIFKDLYDAPLILPNRGFNLTSDLLRAVLRRNMYAPQTGFPFAARIFEIAEVRNGTAAGSLLPTEDPITGLAPWYMSDNSEALIACSDFPDLSGSSFKDADGQLVAATKTSLTLGPIMAKLGLQCFKWSVRPKSPFTGPLEAAQHSGQILFTSNEVDPATPVADATLVQTRFANSALVVQKTVGHTVLLNSGSCMAKHIGAFFQAGVLPAAGATCQPDLIPLILRAPTSDDWLHSGTTLF